MARRILTINTGSSSLKAALFDVEGKPLRLLDIEAERIGRPGGKLTVLAPDIDESEGRPAEFSDHSAALSAVLDVLAERGLDHQIDAAGHRVVYGGIRFVDPQPVTSALLEGLRELLAVDPDHMPQALAAIDAVDQRLPSCRQVVCFDTAFHRHMPDVARRYPLPRELFDAGLRRFGFHGLSYEFVSRELARLQPEATGGRVIVAHLGSGCSMAAVRGGKSIETTMGFSPTGGLMMSTRSGDLDPGALIHLMRSNQLDADGLSEMVNKHAGLLGVSGSSGDMRDLLEREGSDQHAADAIALFCYTARRSVGALAAALGGLDTLVFTGGIGEHSAPIRGRICAGLQFLGIEIEPDLNTAGAPIISRSDARVTVCVIPTDEDLMIAIHTAELLGRS